MELPRLLKSYDYQLPKNLIALKPSRPRDSARLLVYSKKSKKIKFDRFYNLSKYLPKNSVLVFNQTKVLPARLLLNKSSGGKVEALYIDHDKTTIKVIADRKISVDTNLYRNGKSLFKIIKQQGQFYFLKPTFPIAEISSKLSSYGQTPLPPYLKHSPLTEKQRREEYQSIFAKQGLSVAAPTASLHFTKKLANNLKKQGIDIKFITLNVNLGTFAPLKEENIKSGKLHTETYEIDKATAQYLNQAKRSGKTIIAVGTTVARTLESAAQNKLLKKLRGDTSLFIQPGYKFQFTKGLITNFHVPKSSLMMLVAALTGKNQLLGIYKQAINKGLRFFSFGDGMIVLP